MNLIDTDIMIWYMKGNQKAQSFIESESGLAISVITYMEVVQRMRNKRELNALRKALRSWKATIVYVNEDISAKAMFYVEQNYLSHSVHLADALIGATSVVTGMPLHTANDKHYKAIKEIDLHKFHP